MSYRLDKDSLALIFRQIKTNMVAKVEGKGLSSNDFTAEAKSKLDGIEAGAQKNVQADWSATSGDGLIKNKPSIPGKTSELTNDSGFITTSDIPEGAAASTTAPKMAGTATVGTELAFARGDHIHPSDTSRVPVTRTINGKALNANITLSAADVGAATAADVATAKREAIEAILGEGVSENLDTLKEVADWIQSDTTDSAKLITRVSTLENTTVKADDITSLNAEDVEAAWADA